MATTLDVITTACQILNVVMAGESLSAADADLALTHVNLLIDEWNADRQCVWTQTFTDYVLTPQRQPHTIGPTGTFVVASRPVSIESLALAVSGGTIPITVRDVFWWQAQPTPALSSPIPTDGYYDPAVPNGALYFWPVPTVAQTVILETRVVLTDAALTDVLVLPRGYRAALTYTLAESLCTPFGRTPPPELEPKARRARARAFAANLVIPPVAPVGGEVFDYRSRSFHA